MHKNTLAMETKKIHSTNQRRWEAAADNWADNADSRGIWKKCSEDPSIVFCQKTLSHLTDIKDKKVAVLGSGDNEAVFALAGMGAQVTSIDISENQLKHAKRRSKELGLSIEFVRQDVINLEEIADGIFDLVYTGGHVAVWVADLDRYYKEAARILKPGGKFIVEEYHPFRRVWKETKNELVVGYNYFDRGSFRFQYSNNVLYPEQGEYEAHEFHYTVSDYCMALLNAGFNITDVYEYGDKSESWEVAAMDGLPEILSIVVVKR